MSTIRICNCGAPENNHPFRHPFIPASTEEFRSDRELLRDILNFNRSRADNHPKFDAAINEACKKVHGFDPRPRVVETQTLRKEGE